MSDDDCDIFSAARKRIPEIALPKESYNLGNDSFSKEVDYDFIEDLPKKSTKTGKRKNPAATRENPPKSQEDASPPKQAGEPEKDARKERSLSPVSLLILEMEKKNVEKDAKENELGPVARRTRSSLNKTKIAPPSPPPVSATVEVPTQVKPKKRGKKKRTSLTTTTNNSVSVEASLPSIHLYQNKDHTSRRQTVAEVAARSKVVDSIDMVSAVAPRVEGFFNLDSEDEGEEEAPPVVEEENIFDNDNPTIEVALSWLGEIQIYKLRQHQKFKHLFKELASRNGLDENDITVDMYYNFVGPEDTPHSIGLKSFHTLTGHLTKSQNNNHVAAKNDYNPEALCRKPKKFQVKVQADKWKYPLVIPMKKTDNFKILFIKCAEELNCDPRSIKLFFDGDVLDPNDTPNNQDMEGNEVIDLKIKA
ncbi:uncharacterized protein CG4449 isoform X2 [Drosophila simulans]|uniref:GD18396 n=1 Tax=Drosophila simulans TaxID=7240 RepID=B4R1E9_DROSI|nr:uncharacterized protein CG4449 isoform X2 [Drosophila simulans]EDX14035.1 GD18396 [Drosophila simulans]KMZ05281.1 uncharacterized protein Dsimw501_GD18396, isoform A [Drosophila simulans]